MVAELTGRKGRLLEQPPKADGSPGGVLWVRRNENGISLDMQVRGRPGGRWEVGGPPGGGRWEVGGER
jgi:hypothetical protein